MEESGIDSGFGSGLYTSKDDIIFGSGLVKLHDGKRIVPRELNRASCGGRVIGSGRSGRIKRVSRSVGVFNTEVGLPEIERKVVPFSTSCSTK